MIKVTGINELVNGFELTIKGYPKEVSGFLKKEGNKLKKDVKSKANGRIQKRTGNYLNGVTVQKPYNYYKSNGSTAKDSVKVYGSRGKGGANHTHLIEQGHEKWLWGNRTADRVRAFYIYRDAGNEYASKFESNCEDFVNKVIAKLLW